MKEIIYLDTDIMNSLLAQLDQGIISSFTNEQTSQETESISVDSSTGKKAGVSATLEASTGVFPGGKIGFNGSLGSADSEGETSTKGFTEGQRDLLNKKFHDYSLNILIEKLKDQDLIKINSLVEGDIVEAQGKYDFYDFSLINVASDPDFWKEIMSWADYDETPNLTDQEARKAYEKILENKSLTKKEELHKDEAIAIHQNNLQSQQIIDVMKKLAVHSSTTDKLFKDLTLIKIGKLIGLLKKQFLRESTESLSFRGDNARKVMFLGRVIGVKDDITDGNDLSDFTPNQINKIPNIILDILLGSFNILEVGDTLISPIAVYYESN